ncbi:MAG: cytochrome b/b6 domain-containing protein [Hyphomonadaceae bacterium]
MLLLILSALLVFTGLFSSGEHNAGPFAGFFGFDLGEAHEFFFRILQAVVVLHLAGVAIESVRAGDALVPAMISGR